MLISFRFLFVDLEKSELQDFIEEHNGKSIEGREIEVSEAKTKTEDSVPTTILLVRNLSIEIAEEKLSKFFPNSINVRRPTERNSSTPVPLVFSMYLLC